MKKLTDKIYIAESNSHSGFFAQEYFLPHKWGRFKSIEYIRKDVLLELAKERYRAIENDNQLSELFKQGVLYELHRVIEKIESL